MEKISTYTMSERERLSSPFNSFALQKSGIVNGRGGATAGASDSLPPHSGALNDCAFNLCPDQV